MRRRLTAGLTLLAALSYATTACTTDTPTPAPVVTESVKPVGDLFSAAAAKTTGQSFTFDQTYGTLLTSSGGQDSTGKNFRNNVTISVAASGLTMKAQVLSVDGELFLKLDLGPMTASIPGFAEVKDKWMRADRAKIGTGGLASSLTSGGVGMTADSYIKGVVSSERVDGTQIKGTIDLAKSAPSMIDVDDLAAMAPTARIVPFVATLDDQGRIGKIVISMPAVGDFPATDLITTYSEYGSDVKITKPASAEIVEAPAMIYQFLT